jgi:predicted amidohydrolase
VASGYDFRSGIFDPRGERIADAKGDPDVLVVEVDLANPTLWPWVGYWGARIGREAPAWGRESR